MSEFLKVNPELGMMSQSSEAKNDRPEKQRQGYIKLVVVLGAGALVLTGCSMPQEKTETAYFNVVCDDDSDPLVTSLHQEDKPTMHDTDVISVACIDEMNDVASIKGIAKVDTAEDSNVVVVYRYGDGFMQEGKPQITTDQTTGKISFYGESTVESAVVEE